MSLKSFLNVYEFETTLPGSKNIVKYKGFSTNTMKKLLVFENEKDPLKEEEILDKILKMSILDENVNIDDMYVLDRYYLFIKIREATKGSEFTFTHTCNECKSQSLQVIDLKNLTIEKPEIKDDIRLLNGQLKMELDFPFRKDQKKAYSYIKKHLSYTEKKVDMQLADLASMVNKITSDNKTHEIDLKELIDFIGDLPENEKSKFDTWIEKNKFGIDLKHEFKCDHCGHSIKRDLPMTNFFS